MKAFCLVLACILALSYGITFPRCSDLTTCGDCTKATAAISCAWCGAEKACVSLASDGTTSCAAGQMIYTGYCDDGSVASLSYFEAPFSGRGGATHGFVGIAILVAAVGLFRVGRSARLYIRKGKDFERSKDGWFQVYDRFRSRVAAMHRERPRDHWDEVIPRNDDEKPEWYSRDYQWVGHGDHKHGEYSEDDPMAPHFNDPITQIGKEGDEEAAASGSASQKSELRSRGGYSEVSGAVELSDGDPVEVSNSN